jgi:hypothetical protein
MALYDLRNRTTKFGQVRHWTGQDGRKYSDTHKGDDYAETHGHDAVYAIEPGVVVKREYSSTFGHMLWVRRADGVVVRYHMLNEPSLLNVGDQVLEGLTLIGFTGASAANATGNHVHVQVEVNGKPVDPRPYIDSSVIRDDLSGGEQTAGNESAPLTPTSPEEDDMFSDEDRKKLDELWGASKAQKPSADYSLVRLSDRPEVFLSVNRESLRWIKDERELELIRYTLRGVGAPAADRPVEVIGDLPAYGTIIGDRPAGY